MTTWSFLDAWETQAVFGLFHAKNALEVLHLYGSLYGHSSGYSFVTDYMHLRL